MIVIHRKKLVVILLADLVTDYLAVDDGTH